MRRAISLSVVLLFSVSGVFAQSRSGQDLYDYIIYQWNDVDHTRVIAHYENEYLREKGLSGNQLAYALTVVARANRRIGSNEEALQRIQSIDREEITFEPTFWDVVLYEGLAFKNVYQYIKADSVFKTALPLVPKTPEHYSVLSIGYTNYSSIREYFMDSYHALSLQDSVSKYNGLINEGNPYISKWEFNNKAEKISLIIDSNIESAIEQFNAIDTTGLSEESIIIYSITGAKIDYENKDFESALAGAIVARDLAVKTEYEYLIDRATKLGSKARLAIQTEERERQAKIKLWTSPITWLRIGLLAGFISFGAYSIRMFAKNQDQKEMDEFISDDLS
jgi:hypothetical protein